MKYKINEDPVIGHLMDVERRERALATSAKKQSDAVEHRRKADAAKTCRERLQNKGYQRSDGGYIYTARMARDREDQRRRIKAMLKRSGV